MKPNIMKTHIILILGLGRGGEATDLFLSHRTAILRYKIKLKGLLIYVRSRVSNGLFLIFNLFCIPEIFISTNISDQLFDYIITFVNSQFHQNTIQKVILYTKTSFKRSFSRFLVSKNKSELKIYFMFQVCFFKAINFFRLRL